MIHSFSQKQIVAKVLETLPTVVANIRATSLIEDTESMPEYRKAIEKLKTRGVQYSRRVFSQEAPRSTSAFLSVQEFLFQRMLLLDESLLFFGIPTTKGYNFFMTDEAKLIRAFKEYFDSLPKNK